MRNLLSCVASLVLFAGVAAGQEPPDAKQSDADIKKLIVGKWVTDEQYGEVKVKVTTHYKKDGTVDAEGTLMVSGMTLEVAISGTWELNDGELKTTVTKTNDTNLIEKGQESKYSIIAVDDKVLKYKTEEGREISDERVKE